MHERNNRNMRRSSNLSEDDEDFQEEGDNDNDING